MGVYTIVFGDRIMVNVYHHGQCQVEYGKRESAYIPSGTPDLLNMPSQDKMDRSVVSTAPQLRWRSDFEGIYAM